VPHPGDLFESAWLKWSWAVAHTETLKAAIGTWAAHPDREAGIKLRGDYDAKRHRIDVIVDAAKPLPVEWGLIIGDIAHSYRSCLDNIAWALVTVGRTPPNTLSKDARRRIYFPICYHRNEFNGVLPQKLPGVRRADIAIVRRYQPYHERPRRRTNHAFAILSRLNNDDKHKTLQPAQSAPRGMAYDITRVHDCTVTRIPAEFTVWEPLQVGTKLVPVYVRRTGPNPYIEVEGHLASEPALQQGVLLSEWVTLMRPIVANLLGELSDPPTKLLAKLGTV
jgi:hypothetical protein